MMLTVRAWLIVASSRSCGRLRLGGEGVLGGADGAVGQVVGGLDVLPADPRAGLVGDGGVDEGGDGVGVRAEARLEVGDGLGGARR